MDLSLVSTADLVSEIKKRSDHAIFAFSRYESGNEPILYFEFSKKSWMNEVALAEMLKNTILNNLLSILTPFLGRTLQKLNEDKENE